MGGGKSNGSRGWPEAVRRPGGGKSVCTRPLALRRSAGTGRQNARRRVRAAWCRCRIREARRTRRRTAPLPALPYPPRAVAAELPRRKRPDRPDVPGDPSHLLAQAPPELRRQAVPGGIRAAEQRHETHARSALYQLSRQLERHGAAGAAPGQDVRAVRLERPDLFREVRREVLHARERLAPAVEPGRLEPEERLVVAQLL